MGLFLSSYFFSDHSEMATGNESKASLMPLRTGPPGSQKKFTKGEKLVKYFLWHIYPSLPNTWHEI